MLTANQAKAKASNDLLVFHEVRDIEEAILTAAAAGAYSVSLSSTSMTDTGDGIANARLYFAVWTGSLDDRAKYRQMSTVIQYFADLGYSIERRTNPLSGDTFSWHIYW
jgi:hypothetical protein